VSSTKGIVHDLDYIQHLNWCQVSFRNGFVGFVREPCLLLPLAAALKLGEPILVDHDDANPNRIQRVVITRKPPALPAEDGLHYVEEIDVDEAEGKCKVTLVGKHATEVKVFTRDQRMESILVTALLERWKVGYLSFDQITKEITRGKLNIEDQQRVGKSTDSSRLSHASGTAQLIIDHCFNDWDANKDDCNKFVKAVSGDLGVYIPEGADADAIVDFLAHSSDWTELTKGNGQQAKDNADVGKFVIGGMKGSELNPAQDHGHVVIVMSGDLDPTHNQYPRASWGTLNSVGEKDSFVNYAFNTDDRDNVRYFSRSIGA